MRHYPAALRFDVRKRTRLQSGDRENDRLPKTLALENGVQLCAQKHVDGLGD
jgi:hypothetical protein